jgi:hypothetical protein
MSAVAENSETVGVEGGEGEEGEGGLFPRPDATLSHLVNRFGLTFETAQVIVD